MRKLGVILAIVALGGVVLLHSGSTTPAELSSVNSDKKETSFGDLTADALCSASNTTMALVAAVSFKSGTIPADKPTAQQVVSLLQTPDETWAVSKLTGAQIRAALERSLSRAPLPNNAFLQVAGLKVKYDPERPRNDRITSLETNTSALEDGKKYEVVMPLFLAKGGSGYFQVFDEDNIVRRGQTGLAAVIQEFVDAKDELNYTGQGRITVGS
jgi:2',3'-cyclic-nucleotide 2'-phosphodiesterase/3'-nucleotidase/5'-nucleotidase